MLRYVIKRVLIFIPTLFVISLITFIISINAPGDPVETMMGKGSEDARNSDRLAQEKSYVEVRKKLGLDLPVFYFSITSAASCDTIYKIPNKIHRETLTRLTFTYGNWNMISEYYSSLKELETGLLQIPSNDTSSVANGIILKDLGTELFQTYEESKIKNILNEINTLITKHKMFDPIFPLLKKVNNAFEKVVTDQNAFKKYIPVINFYGIKNQYHKWLLGDAPWFGEASNDETKGFIRGDFGISYMDKRPVSSVIWNAMGWTLSISLVSIILAYFIAVPLGVVSASKKGKTMEKSITTFLFMLYSLPNFWIATVAVIFLCGGDWLSWFPSPGQAPIDPDLPFMERLSETAYRMALPVICWTYGSLAFISRQMRGGMLNVLGQDFIRTARAKGLNDTKVIWKHALKNSLLPIITLFAAVFPLAISGSFVIEYIFSIPGMGKISYEALVARNYPIIFTVMMFTALLTMLGNLVADIMYAQVDPRISFSKK